MKNLDICDVHSEDWCKEIFVDDFDASWLFKRGWV